MAAREILTRVRLSYLRVAFAKYRRRTTEKDQLKLDLRRAAEYKQRLIIRQKRRIFNSIRAFSGTHVERCRYLRILFKSFDYRSKCISMLRWKVFTKAHRNRALFAAEKSCVASIDALTDDLGTKMDILNELRKMVEYSTSLLSARGRLIIQKWFMRFHKGGQSYGLRQWRHQVTNLGYNGVVYRTLQT